MSHKILTDRFEIGQELTHHELQQAYKRITGRPLPGGRRSADVARSLAASCPVRFEFEINRLRGFAWDADECPGQ